jgi:DhnA family fructose-bisphosphate aldolase class Ia
VTPVAHTADVLPSAEATSSAADVLPSAEATSSAAAPVFARDLAEIRDIRAHEPERIASLLASRRRRPFVPADGRLMIVAADHPARGALSARGRADAMASRPELLERLVTALGRPGVDGVLATSEILEDLLLLGALEGKVVVSSMNRGGLAGSVFEMDDRMTGYDVRGTVESGFDAAKMLTRIDLDDPTTVATLETCARAVTDLNRAKLVAMVEPFMSSRVNGKVVNDLSPEAVIKSVHIAQGLGAASAYTWLKLPVIDGMARVMEATTLPTLLLGGDPTVSPEETYASWKAALELPSVRGLIVGRALLYPADGDVAAAVDTAVSLVRPTAVVAA